MHILKESVLCSIATVTKSGRAHISHLYFCWSDDLEFYFLSDPRSLHCRNLLSNPSMAMTVYNSDQPWDRPGRGMQLFGRCTQARLGRAVIGERAYAKRFDGYAAYRAESTARNQAFQYRFYHFTPRKIKILDEPRFGGGVLVTAQINRAYRRGRQMSTRRS